jgi:hypothetical protein
MAREITPSDVFAADEKYDGDFLFHRSISGKTIKADSCTLTYLQLMLKKADGKCVNNPVLVAGFQPIYKVAAKYKYKEVVDTPEALEKIAAGTLNKQTVQLKIRQISIEETEKYVEKMENESTKSYEERIKSLHQNNEDLCRALMLLDAAAEKLVRKLSKINPKDLGCVISNGSAYTAFKKSKTWVPRDELENVHKTIGITEITVKENDEETFKTLDNPIYKISMEVNRTTQAPVIVQKATWGPNRRKDVYKFYIKDFDRLSEDCPLEYEDWPLTTDNIEKAIPRGSLATFGIAIDCIRVLPSSETQFYCVVDSMIVKPCTLIMQDADSSDTLMKYAKNFGQYVPEDTVSIGEALSSMEAPSNVKNDKLKFLGE